MVSVLSDTFIRFLSSLSVIIFVLSFLISRAFSYIYERFDTYHYLEGRLPESETGEGERLVTKIFLVALLYLLAMLIASITIVVYTSTGEGLGVPIDAEIMLGITVLIVIMNASIRVAAFSKVGLGPISKEDKIHMKNRMVSFGFSFLLSVYFLAVLGIGLTIISGQQLNPSEPLFQTGQQKAIRYTLVALASPAIAAITTELILWGTGVPDEFQDAK